MTDSFYSAMKVVANAEFEDAEMGNVVAASAFEWMSYSVSRASKIVLLEFVISALEMRGCRVVYCDDPARAPFYIVFEMPNGDRHAVLVYAFLANNKVTKNRPPDEHRFQIKYGGDLTGVLDVATDERGLVTTIFVGIDTEKLFFVAADPLLNNPSPMSRSIEFKVENVEAILRDGWSVWERDRHPGKSRTRATADLEDLRTEVLVGGRQDRLLDLIILERVARGLDPGERHLIADKLGVKRSVPDRVVHPILSELDIAPAALFDLIDGASRLKMAVRGWVAEQHLVESLRQLDGVSECNRLEEEGKPDLTLRWKGGAPILLECKNTLRTTYADGRPKVDFQRTRASKGNPCSRYYRPEDFPVLAACLHAVTERWEFRFALTSALEPHKKCHGRIANTIAIAEPVFTADAGRVFELHYAMTV